MEIKELKRRLLREELRRRGKSPWYRRRAAVFLLLLTLVAGGASYYEITGEHRLEGEYERAESLVAEGEYGEAVRLFRRLHDRHPFFSLSPRALFRSGEILDLYLGKPQEALLAFLLVIKDYPQTEIARRAQREAGAIYKDRLQDYGRAIVTYQRLLDSGARDGDRIQYEVGDAYFRQNNFEQARIEFEALLKDHPESSLAAEVRYRIAVSYSLEGALEEAEEAYREVMRNWPESPYALEARFGLAAALEEMEELREALMILQGLQGSYPNPEALQKKIAQVRERIRKKKRAI